MSLEEYARNFRENEPSDRTLGLFELFRGRLPDSRIPGTRAELCRHLPREEQNPVSVQVGRAEDLIVKLTISLRSKCQLQGSENQDNRNGKGQGIIGGSRIR